VLNFLNNENLDLELSQSSHDMVLSIISRLRQINSDTTSSQNELTDVFNQIINDIADIKTEIRSKIYRGIIDSPIRTFSSPVRQETVPIIPTSISPADEISSESGSIFDTPLVPWGDEVSE
jgi:hypothetical protein